MRLIENPYKPLTEFEREKNMAILKDRVDLYNQLGEGPRVGEYLKLKDGTYVRFTHDWDDSIQTTCKKYGGSFHLGKNTMFKQSVYMSYSGSLDPSINKDQMKLTDEIKEGRVWFFKDDWACANNGLDAIMPFRVWRLI